MSHALPRRPLSRRVLPALLLSAFGVAFAGLIVVAPVGAGEPTVLAHLEGPAVVVELAPTEPEREQARASRNRRLDELAAAREAAAEAQRVAEAEAAARAAAEAEAQAAAEAAERAKAEAAAKAKAEAEAAAKAAAAKAAAPRAASRAGGACPVPNASFTDTWGEARSGGRSHKGTDLMAPHGSAVYAVTSGRVRTASSSAGGISLYLDADNGETYFYAHNQSNVAGSGQRVAAGDLIARVGSSGNASASAPHVHFERHVGGRAVNPYAFLRGLCR